MHQALDPLFQLDERAVGENVDDLALDLGTDREAFLDIVPRTRQCLLESERDSLALLVDLQHLDVDFLLDLEHLRGVIDSPPGHVGDVEEAIDATEVDERAEVGDVLDGPPADLVEFDLRHQVGLLLLALLLQQFATADDDVHARLIDFDDLALKFGTDELADIANPADRDLRSRQEDRDFDVDEKTAFDLPHHFALDDVAFLVGGDHLFPTLDPVRLALRQEDLALLILDILQEHIHRVSFFDLAIEMVSWNDPLGLVAHVHHDDVVTHRNDRASGHLVDFEVLDGIPDQIVDLI